MSKGSSSKRWLHRHTSDPYVRQARTEGWRSRAVYKLTEIQARDRLLRPGLTVVDLGSAPGGWSQYAASLLGDSGRVIAVDLLEMDAIAGVEYIHGDFGDEQILEAVKQRLGGESADLVMSDMAPNISGNASVDQPRSMYLAELALEFARGVLKPGGDFVVKLFHGEGFDEFVRLVRQDFEVVKVRKPAASRPKSRETYLVARRLRV